MNSAKKAGDEKSQKGTGDSGFEVEEFLPEWSIPPGEILQAEINARHMTQAELAARTGLSTKHLNQVIKGLVPLSFETAEMLEIALGIPSFMWNHWEMQHRTRKIHQSVSTKLQQFESWLSNFKVSELKQRGVITKPDRRSQAEELLRFLGVVSPQAFDKAWMESMAMSFRRAQTHAVDPYATAVWLRLGERRADAVDCQGFDSAKLRDLVPELRPLTKLPYESGLPLLQELCRAVGVAMVFVTEIKGSRASGATKWLSDNKVMIAASDRYKLADSVWFTVFHELAHALLHARRRTYVDLDASGDDENGMETQANEFAMDALLPGVSDDEIRSLSVKGMRALANDLNVDSGIVAGRYAFITKDPSVYAKVSRLRHKFEIKDAFA